jgi:hypothetical protein
MAKMGLTSDPNAVVDARLRSASRPARDDPGDADITSGNTPIRQMMIAEKGPAMALADQRR